MIPTPLQAEHQLQQTEEFDRDLSRKIDVVVLALEVETSGIRRRWLLLRKWWYERQVPAWYPEVQS